MFQQLTNNVSIGNGIVRFRGYPMASSIAKAILDNYPYSHMPYALMAERIYTSPMQGALYGLLDYLTKKGYEINSDGTFMAYKAISSHWMDIYSGTMYNGVGMTVSIPLSKAEYDPNLDCAAGLHVGTKSFAKGFSKTPGNRFIQVKVCPSDVVSVPYGSDGDKIRVKRYTVLKEVW